MKINQHIEDYLNAYLGMKEADFAVMITGPWGCGKTRFIDDYLKTGDEKDYVYFSLNGISSVSDIDMKISGGIFRLPNGEKTAGKRINGFKGNVTPTMANMKYLKGELDKIIEFFKPATAGSEDLK